MRNELLFDELNVLRYQLAPGMAPDGTGKKPKRLDPAYVEDSLLDLLIMAYMYGVLDLNEQLGVMESVDTDKMYETVYKRIADKTFADRVREYANTGDIESIMRVAETEIERDYNTGSLDAAESTGLKLTKTWMTMRDDRVRDTHEPLQSVTVPLEDKFYAIDGDSTLAPGGFEKPENNVNCRCWLQYRTV